MANIQTLGDSTLDNLYWLLMDGDLAFAKKNCVEGHLRQKGHQVTSHAYDGFTTSDVLNKGWIGTVLPRTAAYYPYMEEKAAKLKVVEPLQELKKRVSEESNVTHYVVISVGGNDFRVNLLKPWRLIQDIPQIQERYREIVRQVKTLQGRVQPILIFQYLTDAKNDCYGIYTIFGLLGTTGVAVHLLSMVLLTAPIWTMMGIVSGLGAGIAAGMGATGLLLSHQVIPLSVTKHVLMGNKVSLSLITAMMQRFYQPVLEMAKSEGIPILDLPNTFNPFDDLYECGIEPNTKGGKLIAEGIDRIVNHHDFAKQSKLYSKKGSQSAFSATDNADPAAWTVALPSKGSS